jgi:hypothetical protein
MSQSLEKADLWHAMSDLYLDEEMTLGTYLYIAERLASSDISLSELDAIFFDEVHPVLCWNLKAVAGHWGDFGKEWVAELIAKSLRDPPKKDWLTRVRERQKRIEVERLKTLVKCNWEKVKLLIEVIRGRGLREITK